MKKKYLVPAAAAAVLLLLTAALLWYGRSRPFRAVFPLSGSVEVVLVRPSGRRRRDRAVPGT